jgi:hypothetical protein
MQLARLPFNVANSNLVTLLGKSTSLKQDNEVKFGIVAVHFLLKNVWHRFGPKNCTNLSNIKNWVGNFCLIWPLCSFFRTWEDRFSFQCKDKRRRRSKEKNVSSYRWLDMAGWWYFELKMAKFLTCESKLVHMMELLMVEYWMWTCPQLCLDWPNVKIDLHRKTTFVK